MGGSPVVRVEFEVDGKPTEGEDAVQYFRMSHSSFTGWQVNHKTAVWTYYLPFLLE
jgi:hypothetical protein